MSTSSNCFNRKKQDAMHWRPGMVSEEQAKSIRTELQNRAAICSASCIMSCNAAEQKVTRLTTFACRAPNKLEILLRNL